MIFILFTYVFFTCRINYNIYSIKTICDSEINYKYESKLILFCLIFKIKLLIMKKLENHKG